MPDSSSGATRQGPFRRCAAETSREVGGLPFRFGGSCLPRASGRQLPLKGSTIGRSAPAGHVEDARVCLTIGRRHRNDELVLLHIQLDLLWRKIARKPEGTQGDRPGEW